MKYVVVGLGIFLAFTELTALLPYPDPLRLLFYVLFGVAILVWIWRQRW